MKLLRKISIGSINGVRGGLRNIKGRVRVMTIAGIVGSYKEKTSETMGVSYAFQGEFRAINQDGVEARAPVAYLPEPAQSLLKTSIDDIDSGQNVEFGFHFYAIEDETSITGYVFECVPLMEAAPSSALQQLSQRLSLEEVKAPELALEHDGDKSTPAPVKVAKGGKAHK